jgi:hypothetical protein
MSPLLIPHAPNVYKILLAKYNYELDICKSVMKKIFISYRLKVMSIYKFTAKRKNTTA